jgi:hypothetical protein
MLMHVIMNNRDMQVLTVTHVNTRHYMHVTVTECNQIVIALIIMLQALHGHHLSTSSIYMLAASYRLKPVSYATQKCCSKQDRGSYSRCGLT